MTRVVVLTGAGVSVASGLPVFRPGADRSPVPGADLPPTSAELPQALPQLWAFVERLQVLVRRADPNDAHRVLAELARRPGVDLTLVTQNVDGLHGRAGSDALELHGSLWRTRCTRCGDAAMSWVASSGTAQDDDVPQCPLCHGPLRPDVVLFGEPVDAFADWQTRRALRDVDLFVAVGTSGTVAPANGFVRSARYAGARTVLLTLETTPADHETFDVVVAGSAEHDLRPLLDDLLPRQQADVGRHRRRA